MNTPNPEQPDSIVRTLGLDKPSRRGARLRRGLMWGSAAALVVIIGILLINDDTAAKVNYKTQPAERGNLVVTVSATGTLEPTNKVDVGSEISGTIKSVLADFNNRVKVGQVLARLDTTKLQAQVLQSRAALESARARVLQARASIREADSQVARLLQVRELSGGKVPSQHELDTAQAALDRARADEASAKAMVAQSQATLDVQETDLAKAAIRSPINGVVLKRSIEPGQTVAASFQAPVLFVLAEDLARMELQVDIDEADVGQVRKGQEATFTVDAWPDRSFPARITRVNYGSQTVEGVVTYQAVLRVDNADLSLRPGMTATAVIVTDKIENALLVPNAALRFTPPVPQQAQASGGGTLMSKLFFRPFRPTARPREENSKGKPKRVWTLRDGQPEQVILTTGASNGILTVVTDGKLEPGTPLVIDQTSGKP